MDGFDWDEENIGHIARHSVTPFEVQDIFSGNYVEEPDGFLKGEERFRAYGISSAGRFLAIAFTERSRKVRPITAWDMSRSEREKYAKKIIDGF